MELGAFSISGERGPNREIALNAEVMSLIYENNKSLWIGLIEDGLPRDARDCNVKR